MKKFMIYVVIIVTFLFLGFTVYYLTQNNENIFITISKDESIYKNEGDSILLDSILTWTKPYKDTTLNISSADTSVVTYDENTKRFDCLAGGFTTITITPSNENFGPFIFEIYVGDGSLNNPFVVDSAEKLALIGNDPELKFTSSSSYILTTDIDLNTQDEWTPLNEFSGNFDGNGHVIYNLNITSGSDVGLFSKLSNTAVVQDIKFALATLNGSFDNAGVVAGINKGTIGKCEVISATIYNTLDSGNTGTIAGANLFDNTTGMINMCSANAKIKTAGATGGIVGVNQSSIVLNSRAIVEEFEAITTTLQFGGIVGINKSTYNKSEEVYYPAAIKNSYAVINKLTADSSSVGGIVGENKEDTYTGQFCYNTYLGCIYALNAEVTANAVGKGSELLDSKASLILTTKDSLLKKATYNGYNFDSVWSITDSQIANINFEGNYETYKVIAVGKEITSDLMSLKEYLENVRNNLSSNTTTYKVTEDTVIDLNGAYWSTIAPSQDNPMLASIIVEDGVTCKITNFRLKDSNSSFFGYISGNTIIKGITFADNIVIESCSATDSAIVTSGLLNGATLENISVKNFVAMTTTGRNVAVICANNNNGSIINCSVACSELKKITIQLTEELTNMGTIVGNNAGYVSGCVVSGVQLAVNLSLKANGSLNFGGIVGINNSTVSNCKVVSFVCDTTASGVVYGGGVVGYTTTETNKIIKCFSLANIKITSSNSSAYVGGIAGYVSASTEISGSFFDSGEISAYNVGGLGGINYGKIKTSYVGECQLTGIRVGGLSVLTYGKVTDCYVLANLNSINADSKLCGITYLVGPDCHIEHIFSNATFSGNGKFFAESQSEFRMNNASLWISNITNEIKFGKVINNIVLVNNSAKVQGSGILGFTGSPNPWIDATAEQCRGSGNYSVFKDKAGFDATVWNFENDGAFPTLRDVVQA